MAKYSLKKISDLMGEIDICMMVTQSARGIFNSRPMSNNGDVKYNGNSYFFTYEKSQKIKDIQAHPQVCLNFEGKNMLYLSVSGRAKLIRDKSAFEEHWMDSLDRWFPKGIDTPGMVLIHVKAGYIQYWQKENDGKIKL